jgi:Flp pilus assembly protein TadG
VAARQKIIQSLWRDTDASALVEATVLTPVLIALFFGVFEFSWYFYNQQLTEIGVRDAARYLARGPYLSSATFVTEGTNPCSDATNVDAAKNLAVYGNTNGSGAVRVRGWAKADVTITCDFYNNNASPPDYAGPGTIYHVTVSTTFADPSLGYFGMLGVSIPGLSASHTQRAFGSG